MSVFVEARTDPFIENMNRMSTQMREGGRLGTSVRRPVRGFQIKGDTFAVIRVCLQDGTFLPVLDAAGDIVVTRDGKAYTTQYTNFLIQTIVDARQEKQQIVECFGDPYIFFYGQQPRVLQVSGLLLNTADFNWRAEWWYNYERYFRGTRLAELKARLYLIYDDIIVEGFPMECTAQENSQQNNIIQMQFNMFVSGYTNVSSIGNPNFPVPDGEIDYTNISSYGEAVTQMDRNRNLQKELRSDAVKRANQGAYLGSGALLASVIKNSLAYGEDPTISGFLKRASGAIVGVQPTGSSTESAGSAVSPSTMGMRPNPFAVGGDAASPFPLRSTFADNADEFIGGQEHTLDELAAPLDMADRWLAMDRAVDNAVSDHFEPTDRRFWDLMGRAGRADAEIRIRGSFSRTANGVFQTGIVRTMTVGVVRDIPFGMGAFAETE